MLDAINFQLTMFGKYSVPISPEMATEVLSKLNNDTQINFVPTNIFTSHIDPTTGKNKTIANLGFFSVDQKYTLAILSNRIDVIYDRSCGLDLNIEDFFDSAKKIFCVVSKYFNVKSNRLAANIYQVYKVANFNALNKKGKAVVKAIDYYNDKDLFEWSTRINSQVEFPVNEVNEHLNIITEISSTQTVNKGDVGVMFHYDINTLSQNTTERFDTDALSSFVESITPVIKRLTIDCERMIVDD